MSATLIQSSTPSAEIPAKQADSKFIIRQQNNAVIQKVGASSFVTKVTSNIVMADFISTTGEVLSQNQININIPSLADIMALVDGSNNPTKEALLVQMVYEATKVIAMLEAERLNLFSPDAASVAQGLANVKGIASAL